MNAKQGFTLLLMTILALSACDNGDLTFPRQEELCGFDADQEETRLASAALPNTPAITSMDVDGQTVWTTGSASTPVLKPGQIVTLKGTNLGYGVDIDFSKIMLGNSRVLETDLDMYEQKINLSKQVHYELTNTHSNWAKDVLEWSPEEIVFRVPVHASKGPLLVQTQKRIGYNESLLRPGESHNVLDAQTLRITELTFDHKCDVVSKLGAPATTLPIPVTIQNDDFDYLVARGEEIFWSYDFNIGLAHQVRNLDWSKIMRGEATDPITGALADPALLFGAIPEVRGQVPDVAIDDVYFDPYPSSNPIPGFITIGKQFTKGNTSSSGYVGYRYADANHPYTGRGAWIGFNCASCHSYQITYENSPGNSVTKTFGGLPNPNWSMKWALLGNFDGIKGVKEEGPKWSPGNESVDKTHMVYINPPGAGEHNMIRMVGEGSETDNDYQFSPITIPNVTNHMPIRRSLSHTESYVGFEGSYIHSEEPDGAMGSMRADSLQQFTAYMTTLDKDDDVLRSIGIYRWLKSKGRLEETVGNITEGEFVQNGWKAYPGLVAPLAAGKTSFDSNCGSCHNDGLGANTSETMVRLDETGRFFTPTIYQKDMQSIRATYLRNMYWTEHRGLLSDGHVRNMEDLINPARCTEGSPLYNSYYTLHAPQDPGLGGPDHPVLYPYFNRKGDVFRVPIAKGTGSTAKNRFVLRHKYFVTVPWDPDFYYWDYQKMRAEYGPDELGTADPIGLPATPHPYCASSSAEMEDMTLFIYTL